MFTKTEAKILALLSDGGPHLRRDLHAALYDALDSVNSLQAHICNIRAKLPEGEDIVCELHQRGPKGTCGISYRHVRLLSAEKGTGGGEGALTS